MMARMRDEQQDISELFVKQMLSCDIRSKGKDGKMP